MVLAGWKAGCNQKYILLTQAALKNAMKLILFFIDHTNQYQMHKDSNDIECAVFVTQLYKPCQLFSLSDIVCK